MDLGELCKRLRFTIKTNLGETTSIKDFAKKIGLAAPRISELENNKREMSLTELKAYHNFFNVSFEYLLGETNVSSNNEDIQTACKVTGLSEEAIKCIQSKTANCESNDVSTLNAVLTCRWFWSMVFQLSILERDSKQQLDNPCNIDAGFLVKLSTQMGVSSEELALHIENEFRQPDEVEDFPRY